MIDGALISLERRLRSCPITRPRCSARPIRCASSSPPSPAAWAQTPTSRRSWGATWSARTSPATIHTASSASRNTSATWIGASSCPRRAPSSSGTRGVAALVDAHRGFGQHSTMFALEWAMGRARQHGVAMAAVRHSTHIGRLGEYAERTAAEGLIGIVTVGAVGDGIGGVVPFGGRTRFLGTNPWALSVPGRTRRLIFDAATSTARGGQGARRARGREAVASGRHRRSRRASQPRRRGLLRGRGAPAARRRARRAQGLRARPRVGAPGGARHDRRRRAHAGRRGAAGVRPTTGAASPACSSRSSIRRPSGIRPGTRSWSTRRSTRRSASRPPTALPRSWCRASPRSAPARSRSREGISLPGGDVGRAREGGGALRRAASAAQARRLSARRSPRCRPPGAPSGRNEPGGYFAPGAR